jgi:hypothetical protein
MQAGNWIWRVGSETNLTKKKRAENARMPMRRRVKTHNTPPKIQK